MVVVLKKGGKWRVCVTTRTSTKHARKIASPLSCIDQIVDASTRHGMLSCLDSFSRYHQILMHPSDVEKTAFITLHKLYCYNVMPFGLKNARSTYQRLVNNIF